MNYNPKRRFYEKRAEISSFLPGVLNKPLRKASYFPQLIRGEQRDQLSWTMLLFYHFAKHPISVRINLLCSYSFGIRAWNKGTREGDLLFLRNKSPIRPEGQLAKPNSFSPEGYAFVLCSYSEGIRGSSRRDPNGRNGVAQLAKREQLKHDTSQVV